MKSPGGLFGVLPEIVSEHCTDRILNNLRGYAKQAPKIIFLNFLPFLSQNVIVIRRTSSMRATEKFHREVNKIDIDNVDNLFVKELQTIPLILKMYI